MLYFEITGSPDFRMERRVERRVERPFKGIRGMITNNLMGLEWDASPVCGPLYDYHVAMPSYVFIAMPRIP